MLKYLIAVVITFATAAVCAEPPPSNFLLDIKEHNQLLRADEFVAIGYGHPETRAPIPDELRAAKTASKIFRGATLISLKDQNDILPAPAPVLDDGYGQANVTKVYRSSAGVPRYSYSAGSCSGGSCSGSATGPVRRALRPFRIFRRR